MPCRWERRTSSRAPPALEIAPKEYADLQVQIEHIENLDFFYAALQRTASQEAAAITRVAHYGDSSVAADEITQTLRRKLQRRFGDAGHGFHLTAGGDMHYIHRDVAQEKRRLELMSIVTRGLKSGHYATVATRTWWGRYETFGTSEGLDMAQRVALRDLLKRTRRGDLKISSTVRRDGATAATPALPGTDRGARWSASMTIRTGARGANVRRGAGAPGPVSSTTRRPRGPRAIACRCPMRITGPGKFRIETRQLVLESVATSRQRLLDGRSRTLRE